VRYKLELFLDADSDEHAKAQELDLMSAIASTEVMVVKGDLDAMRAKPLYSFDHTVSPGEED